MCLERIEAVECEKYQSCSILSPKETKAKLEAKSRKLAEDFLNDKF
jgi:hypothetical protein